MLQATSAQEPQAASGPERDNISPRGEGVTATKSPTARGPHVHTCQTLGQGAPSCSSTEIKAQVAPPGGEDSSPRSVTS